MAYHGVDGTVMAVSQQFVDDQEQPLIPAAGYPKIRLYDSAKDVLVSINAAASSEPGKWVANLPIPKMDLESRTEFKIKWLFKDQEGQKVLVNEVALIEPAIDQRNDDIVVLFGEADASLKLPVSWQDGWEGTWQVYYGNQECIVDAPALQDLEKRANLDSTVFTLPLDQVPYASLISYLLSLRVTPPGGRRRTYNYKLYAVTPQIMLAMSHIEDTLNKARIENVIPELRYTDADILSYLERGLYMFNRVGYPTSFNGTNMQGILFDAWLICSSYWAISAQLLAEGSLAFDFSGQGVSLNVDRTPQLDAAIGRIESQIEQHVVPLKKILNTQGLTQGDGSVGATNLNNPRASATMGIINAATTRMPMYSRTFIGRYM